MKTFSDPFAIYGIWYLLKYFGIKIVTAIACGGIIGYEREHNHKVAGLRTMILICIGSMIPTSISFLLSNVYAGMDPTRIIGQIITGVGFLGAGVIMQNKDKITGVTTSSFIWITCSIGILIGTGINLLVPIILTITIVVLSILITIFVKPKVK